MVKDLFWSAESTILTTNLPKQQFELFDFIHVTYQRQAAVKMVIEPTAWVKSLNSSGFILKKSNSYCVQ